MRVSTVAFLLGLLFPAAGYVYLRRWIRVALAYGGMALCFMLLNMTEQMGTPQGVALFGLALGTIYVYALIDGWQIGRRIDAKRLSAKLKSLGSVDV